MNNISPINKAQKLTETEVHAAAEELQNTSGKVTSIELYKHLGRGSLTTITNFLKTWKQEEEKTSALPALINLPDSLKAASEQLIIKVWTESKKMAESELQTQREALRQAEAIAKERIEEAQAFSEEQTKQIEKLKAEIEALENDKYEALDKAINEEKQLTEEITRLQINEGILNEKIKQEQELSTKQFNQIEELLSKIKHLEQDKQKEIDTARKFERVLQADKSMLQVETATLKEKVSNLLITEESNKEKVAELIKLNEEHKAKYEEKIKKMESLNDNKSERLMYENKTLATQRDEAIKETAKLSGELEAWKEIGIIEKHE